MFEYFAADTPIDDRTLRLIAHLPTGSLNLLSTHAFWQRMSDADYMRIAVWLARKSYDEGGCPIGGVIIDNETRRIVGKGHNTLVQDNDPYNHGETSAMRDAGSIDFSRTTMFTTLTPCNVCTTLILERGCKRLMIGNSPNSENNEALLVSKGVEVTQLIDPLGVELYSQFQREKPELDLIDWKGVAALARDET